MTRLVIFCLAVILIFAMPGRAQQSRQALRRHVRTDVSSGRAALVGSMQSTQTMQLSIVLPLRNQAALTALLGQLYDPTSANYHHFLSVDEFTEQFGPTVEDYQALVNFAEANGFTVTPTPANRLIVPIKGTVAQAEAAFNVRMKNYQHPTEKRTFFSPDREPSLPLNVRVAHIAGLDNYSLPTPMTVKPNSSRTATSLSVQGSGPGSSYLSSDMRAAYYGAGPLTGSGQTVGLLQFDGYDIKDLVATLNGTATATTNGNSYTLTYKPSSTGPTYTIPIQNVLLGGVNGATTSGSDAEQVLDIAQVVGMAPGISLIRVYIGINDSDILNAIAADGVAKQVSISWAWNPDDPAADDPFFQEMAAQGQSVFVASGDNGAFSPSYPYYYPAEDTWVTAVGGTSLTTSGPGGAWSAETAWSRSGGGISPDKIAIPSWQAGISTVGNLASTTLRNVPDVALEADSDNYACSIGVCSQGYGGTSFAAPRWAGLMALLNQRSLSTSGGPVGFFNPSLYSTAKGSSYTALFHDITTGNNQYISGYSSNASSGYDLVTGLGTPVGASLIDALIPPTLEVFSLSALPSTLAVKPASSGTSQISVASSSGFTGSVNLSVSGLPSGVTASFSSPTTSDSSILTLNVGVTAAGGSFPIIVTGTSSGHTAAAYVVLNIASNAVSINGPIMPASPTYAKTFKTGVSIPVQASILGSFLSYSVQWAPGILPTSGWASTGVSTNSGLASPIADQTVATWDTSSITTAGYYTIRLLANYVSGSQAATTIIYLEPDLLSANWPMFVPNTPHYLAGIVPLTATDGSPLLGWSGYGANGSLYLTPPNGSSLLAVPYGTYTSTFSPPVGSLNGAAGDEVLVGIAASLDAFRTDGSVFSQFNGTSENGFISSQTVLKDLDQDGLPEVISLEAYPIGSTAFLHALRQNGRELNANFPISIKNQSWFANMPFPRVITGDIDGDGSQEIVAIEETAVDQCTPRLFASDGSQRSWAAPTLAGYPTQIALADLDQNGKLELIMIEADLLLATQTIHVLQPDGTERPGWPKAIPSVSGGTTAGVNAYLAIGDLNQNGSLQIVASSQFTIYVFNSDGNNFSSSWPVNIPLEFGHLGPVVLADVNGDGLPEILAMGVVGYNNPLAVSGSSLPTTIDIHQIAGDSGQSVSTISLPVAPGQRDKAPLLADGIANYIYASEVSGSLISLDRNANILKQWALLGRDGHDPCWPGSITVGDFDHTGNTEIAVSYQTVGHRLLGSLYCDWPGIVTVLNTGAPFVPEASPWPMMNHDPQNTSTLLRRAALPSFSVASGAYTSAQTVTISDSTPSAVIYYTSDGSLPTTSSPQFSGSIAVSATETLRAFAIARGYSPSAVATAAYTITLPKTSPTVAVAPSLSSITNVQALSVTVSVSGTPTPTGTVTLSSGSYASAATSLINGSATISIPAGSLAIGADTLTASYTPDSGSSSTYKNATGSASVTVTVAASVISSPAPGGTLTGASTTFTWNAGPTGVTGYFLWVGTTAGSSNLVNIGPLTGTSATVTLPTNGAKLYVRLWTAVNGTPALYNDYTYTAYNLTAGSITSPTAGSTLTGSSTTFNWTAGTGSVTGYYLWVGTSAGSANLVNIGPLAGTSKTVTLPTSGAKLYVRLWTAINGTPTLYNDYTYTAANVAAASITSPVSGSTLAGASTTLTWNAGAGGVTGYYLWVGTTAGSSNLVNIGPLTGTSTTVTLPTNGSTLYIRLWTVLNGSTFLYNDYTYTAANIAAATIVSPSGGSTLAGASTTFTWNGGAGGVTSYYLWVGTTAGSSNLVNIGPLAGTSTTVTLPTNGAKLFVRLWTAINGIPSFYSDYTYTAYNVSAASIASPSPGSTLAGASTTFTWNAGTGGVTGYYLWVGTTAGSSNLVNIGPLAGTSTTVTLPTNGSALYVRLWTVLNGSTFLYNDYSYTAFH